MFFDGHLGSMPRDVTSADRYRLLLEQMREAYIDERGREHGWKAWAGRKLGIQGEYVGMLLTDPNRGIGTDVLDRAVAGLHLDANFFHDPALKRPHYKDYQRTRQRDRTATSRPDIPPLSNILDIVQQNPAMPRRLRDELEALWIKEDGKLTLKEMRLWLSAKGWECVDAPADELPRPRKLEDAEESSNENRTYPHLPEPRKRKAGRKS